MKVITAGYAIAILPIPMYGRSIPQVQLLIILTFIAVSRGLGEAFPNFNCWLYQKLSGGILRPYGIMVLRYYCDAIARFWKSAIADRSGLNF